MLRGLIAIFLLMELSQPLSALAQSEGQPAGIPRTGLPPELTQPERTRYKDLAFISLGPAVFIPIGNFENQALPSLGIAASGGFWLSESIAFFLNFDYVSITKQDTLSSDINFSFYGASAGIRMQPARQRRIHPFAEGLVGVNTTRFVDEQVFSDSTLMLKLGVGAATPISQSLDLGLRASFRYSLAADADTAAIAGAFLELFGEYRF